jgi:hypothetical protein
MNYQTQIENVFKTNVKTSEQLESYLKAYEDILLNVQSLVTVDDSLGNNLLKVIGNSKKLKDFAAKYPSVAGGDLHTMIGAIAKAYFLDAYLPDKNILKKIGTQSPSAFIVA